MPPPHPFCRALVRNNFIINKTLQLSSRTEARTGYIVGNYCEEGTLIELGLGKYENVMYTREAGRYKI